MDHLEAVESYVNGNISEFKKYLKGLSKVQLLECLAVFIDNGYTVYKMLQLLES